MFVSVTANNALHLPPDSICHGEPPRVYLAECYRSLDGRKAVGADGVTKRMYGHLYVFVRSLMPREWRYLEPIARIGHDGF